MSTARDEHISARRPTTAAPDIVYVHDGYDAPTRPSAGQRVGMAFHKQAPRPAIAVKTSGRLAPGTYLRGLHMPTSLTGADVLGAHAKRLQDDPAVLLLSVIYDQNEHLLGAQPLRGAPATVAGYRDPKLAGAAGLRSRRPASGSVEPTPAAAALHTEGMVPEDGAAVANYLRTVASASHGRPPPPVFEAPPKQPYPLTYISHDRWPGLSASGFAPTVAGGTFSTLDRKKDYYRLRALTANGVVPPATAPRVHETSELPDPPRLDRQGHTLRAPAWGLPENRVAISRQLRGLTRTLEAQPMRP